MQPFQERFIRFAVEYGVLQFGEFVLKSGRVSPYFFNAGGFNTGSALHRLGQFYGEALAASTLNYDMLMGPAYKGIPLVATTAISLQVDHNRDVPFVFNRKETKLHGEGGNLVGAPLAGNVVIVDDVITAGTAIREVMALLEDTPATVVGVVVAIDREERGQGPLSAIQEVAAEFSIEVVSVVKLSDIVAYLEAYGDYEETLENMKAYQETYGIERTVHK
jgi:orotate phosphoribosyltransferase